MSAAKITALRVSNFKRIHEVEVDIDGHVVVGGNNAQGKSSLLDSVEAALLGGSKVPADPVNHGNETAEIKVTLDNGLVIERTITKDRKSKLKISEGKGGTTPQRWLDQHISAITLDPLAILSMSPKDKAAKLREISGVDTDKFDALYKEAFDERTQIKRRLRDAEARLADFPPFDFEAANAELPDIEELTAELASAHAANADRERHQRDLEGLRGDHASKREEIERMEKRLAHLRQELDDLTARGKELGAKVSTMPVHDTQRLNKAIAEHNDMAMKKQRQQQRLKAQEEVNALAKKVEDAEAAVRLIDSERKAMLDNARWPLDGLSIENGEVFFMGVPLEQASQAQQLRVAVALASASKPDIGIVLVRDGCRLDGASLKMLLQEVTNAGLQAFVERVGDGDTGAVIIEDGRIAAK